MEKKLLGTMEQKENKAGNSGIKAEFLIFLGIKEHQNRQKKKNERKGNFVRNKGTRNPLGDPSLNYWE